MVIFQNNQMVTETLLHHFEQDGRLATEIRPCHTNTQNGLLNLPVLKYEIFSGDESLKVAVKVSGREPQFLFRDLYQKYGHADSVRLEHFDRYCAYLSMTSMQEREIFFYSRHYSALNPYVPALYGIVPIKDAHLIIMEDLADSSRCLDQVNHPDCWGYKEIESAIRTLAFFHCRELCEIEQKTEDDGSEDWDGIAGFIEEFEDSMVRYAGLEQPSELRMAAGEFIRSLEAFERILGDYGKKLIHNDFNIRNICIDRQSGLARVYDWEFLDFGNPLMDLVDFFTSLSEAVIERENLDHCISLYRFYVNVYGGPDWTMRELKEQVRINVMKFAATRMNMYLLFYAGKRERYIERMGRNLCSLLAYCGM